MKGKKIETKEEYDKAVTMLEELFNALPDTPEAEELDFHATIIDEYETIHFPI